MGVVTPAMSTNVSPRPRQRRRGAASIVTLFAALLLAGCASSNLAGDSAGEVPAVAEPADAAPEALPADTDGLLVLPDQRMVVHSASMSLLVEDVDEAAAEVKEWVRQAGGYVASETANAASGRNPQVRLSLRVPVDSYEEALNAFAALGTRQSLERSVTDVTEEVADVDSRVASAEKPVARLQELLDEADTISDILEIEEQISSRQAELEAMQARQRVLADQTSYATVDVELRLPSSAVPVDDGDSPGFVGGLAAGWRALLTVVDVVVVVIGWLLPFTVVAAAAAVPVVWLRRRRSRRKEDTAAGTGTDTPVTHEPSAAQEQDPAAPGQDRD